jgi:GNAT superfamily N-acetyltransferase
MSQEIPQVEQELRRSQEQADAAREAERRIQVARDLPQYQQLGDGSYQRHFTDRQGRDMTLRVDGNDSQTTAKVAGEQRLESQQSIRIRVADSTVAESPPAFKDKGQIARANTTLEIRRDANGSVTDRRLRLNDIQANDAYQGSGIGGEMLDEVERIGRQHGAREVYGNFVADAGREADTRRWYGEHGYEFRQKPDGAEEVYKTLASPDTDAAAIRRELTR